MKQIVCGGNLQVACVMMCDHSYIESCRDYMKRCRIQRNRIFLCDTFSMQEKEL